MFFWLFSINVILKKKPKRKEKQFIQFDNCELLFIQHFKALYKIIDICTVWTKRTYLKIIFQYYAEMWFYLIYKKSGDIHFSYFLVVHLYLCIMLSLIHSCIILNDEYTNSWLINMFNAYLTKWGICNQK